MKISKLEIPEVLLIEPNKYIDDRGFFSETFRLDIFRTFYADAKFVQDNLVESKKNVLRGLHYQKLNPQGKLVSVIEGKIFDVAVDIRKQSKFYGKWVGLELSSDNHKQLYIPPGFAHGYCVLSPYSKVMYKCTDYYKKDDQYGIIWNDDKININWPLEKPILSDKDSKLPFFDKV